MRIGIYTQPLRYNYGGLLQAYALQTVLRRMGHEVVTLDPCTHLRLAWPRKPYVYAKRLVKKMLGQPTDLHYEKTFNKEHKIKMRYLQSFVDSYIQRLEYRKISDLQSKDFDVLIAGSDQVWRSRYNQRIENSFFDFAQSWNVRRIAYAASFGTDDWEYTEGQTRRCTRLAKLFSAISVREKSAVELCKRHFGVEAVHVLDPTLLLERRDYEQLIEKGQPTQAPSGDLLCYVLEESEETKTLIARIAHDRNLVPFRANSRVEERSATLEEKVQPPVEQWLRNFRDAEFVVTDSFHACVFSIIFGKPFIVIGNPKRGMSRYESLLSDFQIDNLLKSANEYNPQKDYAVPTEVANILADKRSFSMQFLVNSIGKS